MSQKYSIQLLTGTSEQWANSTYVIPEGELVVEIMSDGTAQLKIGDGLHVFADLKYIAGQGGSHIVVDNKVSATSTNPVQNKVIKAYIDDLVSDMSQQVSDATAQLSEVDALLGGD